MVTRRPGGPAGRGAIAAGEEQGVGGVTALAARAGSETNPGPGGAGACLAAVEDPAEDADLGSAAAPRGLRAVRGPDRFIDREHALVAVTMPDIESCETCRPDIGLGQEARAPGGARRPARWPCREGGGRCRGAHRSPPEGASRSPCSPWTATPRQPRTRHRA
ncbi:DUF6233 domain-containing protein [Streptomyces anulatus]|uniref:DUF6233 domain-containing protein n=1 Tax=Streptomyces anulatus TaxID=1892 RepID=UPI0036DD1B15